jgi:hypothetical protein
VRKPLKKTAIALEKYDFCAIGAIRACQWREFR